MSSVLYLSLFASPARAFAPTADATGIEPVRIQYVHPSVQAELSERPAWRRFVDTDGVGWSARFDEATGAARWLWGRGIAVPTGGPDQVANAVAALVGRHAELLGLGDGVLRLAGANYNAAFDTWYVSWDLVRDGLPVWRGGVSARVKHGKLVAITAATSGDAPVRGAFVVSAARAVSLAVSGGLAPTAEHTGGSAVQTLVERHDPTGLHLERAWLVRSETSDPPGKWVTFVDGASGDILGAYNEIRFVDGSVSAYHHPRTVDGSPLVVSPLPYVDVIGDSGSAATDMDGLYQLGASASYETAFSGDLLTVTNDAGPDASLIDSDPDLVWNAGAMTLAEPGTWLAVNQVRAWAEDIDPTLSIVTDPLLAIVNISMNCNAYYDGNLNFFHTGGGCNNTGEIFDVVFHEWGHGFHASSLEAGFLDGSLGEGVGDVVAFLQTNDNNIGPYFFTNGGPVRDVAPDMVYPDDYRNLFLFTHENGLIFGGAMWDLLGLMQDRYGIAAGTDVTSHLLAGLVKGGPDIVGSYYEILVADDDDADLSNGTPNQCDIIDAFARHGLVGFTLAATHEPLVTTAADAPAVIDATLVSTTGTCAPSTPASASVHYRIGSGAWQAVEAEITGFDLSAEIPGQPLGTFVQYYIDGVDQNGVTFMAPETGIVAPYTYFSGDVLELNCEDFEADDGGYTHQLLEGVAEPGADDWEWGSPIGLAGDPTFAFSGSKVWGTDLGTDGAYSQGKTTYLTSPSIPTGHMTDVFLQYRRWLAVEDASYDQAMILANDELVWTNYDGQGSDQTIDGQWVSHSVDLGGRGDRGELKIGFGIRSDPGLEMAGWTIDDVCFYAPATADNRLGIDDFVVTDLGGPIGLTWTNPTYAPVQQIDVVRRTDRYPNAHDDGEVVASLTAPGLGQPAEAQHANTDGSAGYYAVYASDGIAWSGYTIEGLNAGFAASNGGGPGTTGPGTTGTPDDGDPLADSDGDGEGEGKGGCGCGVAPGSAGGLGSLGLVALGLAIARRRRIAG